MMRGFGIFSGRLIILILFFSPFAAMAHDPLLTILQEELNREMSALNEQKDPPYYIDYRVDEIESKRISKY